MHFITPSDPGITLIGIYETQIYGFGEKNNKLCIYTKSVFDVGGWKEFYMIDIDVLRCDSCENGMHVAATLMNNATIWIAAREGEFTRIFSINLGTKKFIHYKMLQEIYPEFAILDLNLCSKCLSPIIRTLQIIPNYISLVITPQKYQENVGVFHIRISINKSQHCLLWKKDDSFKLVQPPVSSNILVNLDGRAVLSVSERSEQEDGRIQKLSIDHEGMQHTIYGDDNGWKCHEIAFCDGLCLCRRRLEGGNSTVGLFGVVFLQDDDIIRFPYLDYCRVDANFPPIDSTRFFVSYRFVDKEYAIKGTHKSYYELSQRYAIPSFIVAQTAAGIVVIPLRILSLSEAAYISLTRIPQPPTSLSPSPQLARKRTSIFYSSLKRIPKFCVPSKKHVSKKKNNKEDEPWMSIEFIKQKFGWPTSLPLTNAPKLPMVNSK